MNPSSSKRTWSRIVSSSWCVLALACVPSLARADDANGTAWAQKRVEDGLVKPLAKAEVRHFSRERPHPQERRVRIVQATPSADKAGRQFLTFAIDVRYGSDWQENDVVGCVYRGSGELFVKIGDGYRPAGFLLGKNVGPAAGVCEAAPQARS